MALTKYIVDLLQDNPLNGISTYKDVLTLSTGVISRQIKKLVFDGTEYWELQSINEHGIANFRTDFDYLVGISSDRTAINSHFYQTTLPISDITEPCFSISSTSGTLYLKLLSSVASTVADMKSWLSTQYSNGTPVTLWYILTYATSEQITVPVGLSGTVDGYTAQTATPMPTSPIYPISNTVTMWANYTPSRYNGSAFVTATGQPEQYNGGWS